MAVYSRKKKLKSGKHRTYYFYKFDYKGQTIQGVPLVHTRKDAKRAEAEARMQALRGLARKVPTMADFLAQIYWPYARAHKISVARETEVLRDFLAQFPHWRLDEFKAAQIREFLDHRAGLPLKGGRVRAKDTINRELSILSSVFSLAITEEWVSENPCTRVKRHKKPPARLLYWTEAEEARVMPYLTNERGHLRAMVTVALYTGMRREEFLSLKVEHCDFENQVIHVYAPKTRTIRYIGMEPNVAEELRALCRGKENAEFVFVNARTGRRFRDPKNGVKKAAALAGVKVIDWHGLRHTRGTRLALRGMNAFQIAAELGHNDVRTSQIYIHLAEAGKRAAEAKQLFDVSTKDFAAKSLESLENRWNGGGEKLRAVAK